jgi:hypothetical protein
MDTKQQKSNPCKHKMEARMDANQKKITEDMKAWQKEMKTNQTLTDTYPEKMEANPKEIKSAVGHEEVPKKQATVQTFGELKK